LSDHIIQHKKAQIYRAKQYKDIIQPSLLVKKQASTPADEQTVDFH